uniref:MIF4G domain-containing protein n=1 Tax=Caenorhabditis tropicalis TaxID=1561998 RepID=A0A1I7SY10_9PELO
MDQTYAEIENSYAQISTLSPIMGTPKSRYYHHHLEHQQSRKNHHLKEQFDSRLPIEYRYPKRYSVTSSVPSRKGSLVSKGSSSGYSSSGSTSSITTVVNGSKPYRPKWEEASNGKMEVFKERQVSEKKIEASSQSNKVIEDKCTDAVVHSVAEKKSKACCIECREKEIRDEIDLESHQYANLQSIQKPQDPYVFLMTTMLSNLQKDDGGRRVAKVQQKIEKVLRLKPRDPFNIENKLVFDRQISTFASDVTIRLRAICEVAPDTYREVSARFCEALHHHDAPNSKSLKSIVKGVKNLLTF